MVSGQFSRVEVDGAVATVTIDRADRMNALHPAAHRELSATFDYLPTIDGLRAIIVTGAGDLAFCAGYDLKDNLKTGIMELASGGFAGFNARTDYPLPVIAAVNGLAMGGGFELALACDFIIAADHASFALPEPNVGWAAVGGGVQRLPRAIGMKRAMDIILTGRTVSANEALGIGLASEVVPVADLLSAARRWAEQIAACAPLALRCSRQIAYASLDMPLDQALNMQYFPSSQAVLQSEDAVEGKRAFIERRSPRWTGR